MFCIIRRNWVTGAGPAALPAPSARVDVACATGSRPGRGRARAQPLWIGSEGPPARAAGWVVMPWPSRPDSLARP
eukprot:5472223-Prymnesium_polylepis.1